MRASARAAYDEVAAEGGNPSSLHASGRRARARLEDARERVAAALGAHPTEVIFTSGGTEADNLAIKGLFWARYEQDQRRSRIITPGIEHHAALDPARWLVAHQGATLVELPVDWDGVVSVSAIAAHVAQYAQESALVSVMWANNEVGAIEPIAEIASVCAEHGIPTHSDAVQAVAHLDVNFATSGLTSMAVSAHKIGGPIGTGALVVARSARVTPVLHGGGQERGIRSGTLDAPGAAAFAVALEDTVAERVSERIRLSELQRQLVDGVRAHVVGAHLSGPEPGQGRLPANAHFVIDGARAEALLYVLDSHGIEASSASACTAGVVQASHVLLAMGRDEASASSTLRLSLGATSTQADVDAVIAALPDAVARARKT